MPINNRSRYCFCAVGDAPFEGRVTASKAVMRCHEYKKTAMLIAQRVKINELMIRLKSLRYFYAIILFYKETIV